jgi:protein-disulfide isomerase
MRYRTIGTASVGALAILAACGANPEDFRELRDGQRQILAKLADLEKKVEQAAARPMPAAAPGQPDPNKVYTIPVGDSPTKGPANAPVVLAEFSDFQ